MIEAYVARLDGKLVGWVPVAQHERFYGPGPEFVVKVAALEPDEVSDVELAMAQDALEAAQRTHAMAALEAQLEPLSETVYALQVNANRFWLDQAPLRMAKYLETWTEVCRLGYELMWVRHRREVGWRVITWLTFLDLQNAPSPPAKWAHVVRESLFANITLHIPGKVVTCP